MKSFCTLIIALIFCANAFAASYEEWSQSVNYPYSLAVDQKEKLIRQYSTINGVITEAEAMQILGKPDYIVPFYSKGPNREFKGNTYKYVIHKKYKEFANEKYDQYITLFFNPLGKLSSMHPQNLSGLREVRFE